MKRAGPFPQGTGALVGVSGGADSVALALHWHEQARRKGGRLALGHINHGLRGAASRADERFVRELAQQLGVPVHVRRIQTGALANVTGQSVEMAAREARLSAFAYWCKRHGYDTVALAHTLDDQAETILLRWIRGTGASGGGGIREERTLRGLRVVRPLLKVSKSDVLAYLQRKGQVWREDASNVDDTYLRNRVRHELLPLLEERFNPDIRQTLVRTATILRAEDADWEAWVDQTLRARGPSAIWQASDLRNRSEAQQRRLLLRWLVDQGCAPESVTFDLIERMRQLIRHSKGSAQIPLGEHRFAVRAYDRLLFTGPNVATPLVRVNVPVPGHAEVPALQVALETGRTKGFKTVRGRIGVLPAEAWISARWLGRAGLYVRTIRPGDRFAPLGLKGHRKVQDILTDLKLPAGDRLMWPVVAARGSIVWMPGYTIAAQAAVPGPQASSVHLRLTRL